MPKECDVSDIDQALAGQSEFRSLVVPAHLRGEFQAYDLADRRKILQISSAFGVFFFISFLSVDWLIIPDVYVKDVVARFTIGLPYGLAVLLFICNSRFPIIYQNAAADSIGIVYAALLSWLTCSSNSKAALIHLSANNIILIFVIIVNRTPTWISMISGTIIIIIEMTFLYVSPLMSVDVFTAVLTISITFAGTAIYTSWRMQNGYRRNFLEAKRDELRLEELAVQRDAMKRLSAIDPLTGLANRRSFETRTDIVMGRNDRAKRGLAIAMIDIDCFKAFNDHYGHLAGDDALRRVASAIAQVARGDDIAARIGGEEFAVVLDNVERHQIEEIGQRICLSVRNLAIPHAKSVVCDVVTISGGLIYIDPTDTPKPLTSLLSAADEALYVAKNSGRNRFVVHHGRNATRHDQPDRIDALAS